MYLGDYAGNATVRFYFSTNAIVNGIPIAPSSALVAADFRVYKNGSATEKTTTNGITVTSPFDSTTGLHLIEIDTSNNTGDSGFWATGNDYSIVFNSAKTIDSVSQSGVIVCRFSVQNRYMRGTDNANTLTPPTVANIATEVWTGSYTRTLSNFGTLVADIANAVWGATTRTLSAFGFNVSLAANQDVRDVKGSLTNPDAIPALALSAAAVEKIQNGLATSQDIAEGSGPETEIK